MRRRRRDRPRSLYIDEDRVLGQRVSLACGAAEVDLRPSLAHSRAGVGR